MKKTHLKRVKCFFEKKRNEIELNIGVLYIKDILGKKFEKEDQKFEKMENKEEFTRETLFNFDDGEIEYPNVFKIPHQDIFVESIMNRILDFMEHVDLEKDI